MMATSSSARLLPPPCLGMAWRWLRSGAGIPGPCRLGEGSGLQPALRLQSAADGGQGEEGWGAVRRHKLLPEELHVEAEVQCSGQAVRICIHLPDYLQVERQWSGTVQPCGGGGGCWCGDRTGGMVRSGRQGGFPGAPVVRNPSGNAGTQVQFWLGN